MKSKRFVANRSIILALVIALSALAFSACGGAKSKKDGLVDGAGPNPAYLAAIPADTPYVFASLEAIPLAPIMERFEGMGNALDEMITSLQSGPMAPTAESSEEEKLAFELLGLFKGKFSRQGMESIGLSLNPRGAIYGVGFLPVFRWELKDPAKFQNFFDQVVQTAGIELQTKTRGAITYNAIGDEYGELPFLVQGNEFIFGVTPTSMSETYLPYMLGEKKPESSMADTKTLETLRDTHGFKGYMVGYVDLQTIASVMIAPDPGLNGETWVALDMALPTPDAVCQKEYMEMVANYPRVVMGYDRIDRDAMSFRAGLETTNGLGAELAKTGSFIPAYGSDATKDSAMSFGVGIDVQKFLDFLRTKAVAVRENPYQCQNLAGLNQMGEAIAGYSMMAPPALTQIQGVYVAVNNISEPEAATATADSETPQAPDGTLQGDTFDAGPDVSVEGYVFIASAAPDGLLETLKLMNPNFAGVTLKADGTPVSLTGVPGTEALIEPYAVMTNEGIAISSGTGASGPAADALKSLRPTEDTPMALVQYDLAAFASMLPQDPGTPEEVQGMMKALFQQGPVAISLQPNDKGIFFKLDQTWPAE